MPQDNDSAQIAALKAQIQSLEAALQQERALNAANKLVSVREALLVEAERIAHLGSWMWDLQTQKVYWSDELFRIFGKDPKADTATVEAFDAAIHPDDMPRLREVRQRSIDTHKIARIELRIVRPNGEIREIVMDGAFIDDAEGHIYRVIGCCLDVTESRSIQREATRSQALLTVMEQLSGVGAFYWEPSEQATIWSSEMYKIFGTDHALGTPEFQAAIHPDDRAHVAAMQRDVMAHGRGGPVAFRICQPSGRVRHVLMSARTYQPLGAVAGSIVDITDRIHLETQLRQAQKMDAIGRLAGGIAHDFNNLLTAILGNADLLLSQFPNQSLVSDIRLAAEHAAQMTRQLLSFSRHGVSERAAININDTITASLSLLRRVIGEDFTVRFSPEPALWTALVDPHQINQVLLNLSINARDAMPSGGNIDISTQNMHLSASQVPPHITDNVDFVLLRVRDAGQGMDEDTRSKIFDPFFTTKNPGQGTGLGLSTVYAIAHQHGGFIEVDSSLGVGSEFRVYFPKSERAAAVPKPLPQAASHAGSESILLLEDEPRVQRLILQFLKTAGYQVAGASSCSEALERMNASVILLISDIILPDGNGIQLAQELRLRYPALKILHITGYASPNLHTTDPIIEKPFSYHQLLEKVRAILDQ